MKEDSCLRDRVVEVRPDAKCRGNCLFFDLVPLFVLVGPLLSAILLQDCFSHAIGDGFGDPIDLDRSDDNQTARLETAILNLIDDLVIRELLTIHCIGWPSGLQHSLCVASLGKIDLLLMYESHETPAFMTFAFGPSDELLKHVLQDGDLLLPRLNLNHEQAHPIQVAVQTPLYWTQNDVLKCVQNLTGSSLHSEQIVGYELLLNLAQLAPSDEDPQTGE